MRVSVSVVCGLAAISIACGTAVYDHTITVVPVPPPAQLTVAVFDHQSGYTHEFALKVAGVAEAGKPYRATVTTTPAVTLTSMDTARPVDFSLAIPDVSEEGYFLLTIDREADNGEIKAAFCRYGEYFPSPGAVTIPVAVTAHAVKGVWTIDLRVDLARSKAAFTK
jgi:hypothetical protein